MTERLVRVTFRKSVSDSNYGTESAEVTLEDYVADNDMLGADSKAAEDLLNEARRLAQAELAMSPNSNVRRLFQTRTTATPGPAPDVEDEDPVFESQPWR